MLILDGGQHLIETNNMTLLPQILDWDLNDKLSQGSGVGPFVFQLNY